MTPAEADAYARLKTVTRRSEEKWQDVLSLPEPIRTETLQGWLEEGDDWVQNPNYFAIVLDAVETIVSVAAGVGSLASAGTAIAGLKAAL